MGHMECCLEVRVLAVGVPIMQAAEGQSEEIEKRLFYGTTLCRSQYLSRYKRSITGLLCLPFYLPGMLLVRRHEAYSLLSEYCDQYYGYWRGNAWWFLGTCRSGW